MEDAREHRADGDESPLTQPLSGVRVIELCTFVMAPYACQILGDLGADVITVETPGAGGFGRPA